jgi:RNase P/RNase MRP subunit p30
MYSLIFLLYAASGGELDPKRLKKLVKEYYAGTHSKQIAPHLSLTENKSRSFQTFIQGIKNVVEIIQHPNPNPN